MKAVWPPGGHPTGQGTEDLRLDAVPTENRTDWGAASMSQRTCKAFLRVSPLCLYFPFERLTLTYLSSCAPPQKNQLRTDQRLWCKSWKHSYKRHCKSQVWAAAGKAPGAWGKWEVKSGITSDWKASEEQKEKKKKTGETDRTEETDRMGENTWPAVCLIGDQYPEHATMSELQTLKSK